MTLLNEIVDGAIGDTVSTSSLLRKVLVLAHRLDAGDISHWVNRELNGYSAADELPPYRGDLVVNVEGVWSAPGRRDEKALLSAGSIPPQAARALFLLNIFQPVSDLEETIATVEKGAQGIPWDPRHVATYNRWIDEGKVPHLQHYRVISAAQIVTRGTVRGILDSARNTVLDFALRLESAAPDAGTAGGPTIADGELGTVINNFYSTHIQGDGNLVGQGKNINQRVEVVAGDLQSLLEAAARAGLDVEGRNELARLVLANDADRPSKLDLFLSTLRKGSFLVGTSITAEVAAERVSDLITAFFN